MGLRGRFLDKSELVLQEANEAMLSVETIEPAEISFAKEIQSLNRPRNPLESA
jgi:hypothetical protein